MYYGEIKKCDIANGPGVRVSLFVSGCTHHCKGCFNEETWSFEYGKPFTEETEEQILKLLEPSYISGLTVLGGEPMEGGLYSRSLPARRRTYGIYESGSPLSFFKKGKRTLPREEYLVLYWLCL